MAPEGQEYHYLAMAWRKDFGMLPEEPAGQLEEVTRALSARWQTASALERKRLDAAQGCLERLSSFLLQARRMADHAAGLLQRPLLGMPSGTQLPAGATIALQAADVCADFESLLFHGRAALDRLTWFISREYGQKTDRFPRLVNVLSNFAAKDPRAAEVLEMLAATDRLKGVLMDTKGSKSLRSLVTHQTSVIEGTRNVFTIHRLVDKRLLIFDCEALNHPVMATSRVLARDVPFLILNGVATYLGDSKTLALSAFDPPWSNPTVVFTDFLDDTEAGPVFSVCSMNPDGFEISRRHLRSSVLDFAQPNP